MVKTDVKVEITPEKAALASSETKQTVTSIEKTIKMFEMRGRLLAAKQARKNRPKAPRTKTKS